MLERIEPRRWRYLWRGIRGFGTPHRCPCCGETRAARVDRKLVYTLYECDGCALLYRHPQDSADHMEDFYQDEYAAPGLTTDLPDRATLDQLLADDGFVGRGAKDFTRVVEALRALGLGEGATVLDYGASWGYGTYQLRNAGFDAQAFEISAPRAAFGLELGIEIRTDLASIPGPFDAVYSSHVLEHVPDPLATIHDQLELVRPGGYVVAHTPNGNRTYRDREWSTFRRFWGEVHPVLLTDRFVERASDGHPLYVGASGDLGDWDRTSTTIDAPLLTELFFVIRRTDPSGTVAEERPAETTTPS